MRVFLFPEEACPFNGHSIWVKNTAECEGNSASSRKGFKLLLCCLLAVWP